MIWTGFTQFRLCHIIKHAHDMLQCTLVGCMHHCIVQCCPSCGWQQCLVHEKVLLLVSLKHIIGSGMPLLPLGQYNYKQTPAVDVA